VDEAVLEPIDLEAIPLGELEEYERPELTPEQRARRQRFARLGAWGFVVLFALGVLGTPIVGARSVPSAAPRHLVAPADEGPRGSVPPSYAIGERSFIDQRRGFGLATEFSAPPREWTADGPDPLFVTRFVVTTDGGRSWSYVGRRVEHATGVAFINAQHGVLATDGRGLRFTTDGGLHWKQTRQILRSVAAYVSDADGWSSTVDGGASWRAMRRPCPASAALFLSADGRDDLRADCLMESMSDCCARGSTTYRSRDQGKTWRRSKRVIPGTVILSESSHW
jgi:BNR/Asp-box repeat protein